MSNVIIDPTCPEFNRGSFCYQPYYIYAGLKETIGHMEDVVLVEDFNAANIDSLPYINDARHRPKYWIAFWSHSQLEQVRTLLRFLPDRSATVFGYEHLIKHHQMPFHRVDPEILRQGMAASPKYFNEFKHVLLSDCDMHLAEYQGQVYPLCTSYGCPNACSFCPSSANQPKRITLPLNEVLNMLEYMESQGRTNIHFTDEDFFFDTNRTAKIAKWLSARKCKWQIIALSSAYNLLRFLTTYGAGLLHTAGFKLIEVGLETADAEQSKALGKDFLLCEQLAEQCTVPILWLTMTFAPGETIETLGATGRFLTKHGMQPNHLYPRIVTNGTVGGLGQFFTLYEGTPGFYEAQNTGIILSSRPLRLIPSYVPISFLDSRIHSQREVTAAEQYWYRLYRVNPPMSSYVGQRISEAILNWDISEEGILSLAISSRLGVIQ